MSRVGADAEPTLPFESVSVNDQMMTGNKAQYFQAGELALQLCKTALGGSTPARIVDFPSGHGRVMRWFHREWPDAELYGVEVDPDALAFVSDIFGAKAIRSTAAFDMPLPGNIDLIFSGSLLTHLDVWQWDAFLHRCLDALAPGGLLVFTTHGRIAALLAEKRDSVYGNLIDTKEMCASFRSTGFSYRSYDENYPTYGLSLSSPDWIFRRLAVVPLARVVMFEEGGWGGYQDVFALRKNEWPLVHQS